MSKKAAIEPACVGTFYYAGYSIKAVPNYSVLGGWLKGNDLAGVTSCVFQRSLAQEVSSAPTSHPQGYSKKGSPMVRSELIRKIAEMNPQLAPEAVEAAVLVIFREIENALARSNRVQIRRFGVFVTRPRRAHMGRNPKNGVPMSIAAKHVPWFRASNLLLDRLNDRA